MLSFSRAVRGALSRLDVTRAPSPARLQRSGLAGGNPCPAGKIAADVGFPADFSRTNWTGNCQAYGEWLPLVDVGNQPNGILREKKLWVFCPNSPCNPKKIWHNHFLAVG